MFFAHKNHPETHQLSPAFHHEFTIKKPRSATRFSQKPLQKQQVSPHKKNQNMQQPKWGYG
jgi:hypothetical protein